MAGDSSVCGAYLLVQKKASWGGTSALLCPSASLRSRSGPSTSAYSQARTVVGRFLSAFKRPREKVALWASGADISLGEAKKRTRTSNLSEDKQAMLWGLKGCLAERLGEAARS